MKRWRGVAVWGLLALALLGVLWLWGSAPGGLEIREARDGVSLTLAADRRFVVNRGDCLGLRWQVEGNQAIYFNDEGVVGTDARAFCVFDTGTRVEWRIVWPDGTEQRYRLTLGLITDEPLAWGLIWGALAALLMALGQALRLLLLRAPRLLAALDQAARLGFGLLLAGALALLLLELGLRAHVQANGSARERLLYLEDEANIRAQRSEQPMPFLEVGLQAGQPGVNALGYYGPDIALPKPEGVYRIVALGDSSTVGLGTIPQQAYPAQLEAILREQTGQPIEVINGGVVGYNTWHHVVNLAFRISDLQPDLLIVYSATMDIAPRLVPPDCYSGPSVQRGIQPNAYQNSEVRQFYPASVLYRWVGLAQGWLSDPRQLSSERAFPCAQATPQDLLQTLAANPPIFYERNLRSLAGMAQAHGADILFSTWAYGAQINETEAWKQAIVQHNQVMAQVAQQQGALFYDLAATGMGQEADYWFGDNIHQSDSGHRFQAERYAEFLLDQAGLLP